MRKWLVLTGAAAAGLLLYRRNTGRKVPEAAQKRAPEILTPEKTELLPGPVKTWLAQIGAIGRVKADSVWLKQSGRMKLKPEQGDWTAAEAEQFSRTEPPGFAWRVKMKMGKGLFVTGKDRFEDGKGTLRIRFMGVLPITGSSGNPKTDQSSLQRYLMELPWYPSAAVSPFIAWREIDKRTAEAVMAFDGVKGSVIYHFNEDGILRKVTAMRYKESGESSRPLLCTGEIRAYTSVEGLSVPSEVAITWALEEGPFTWYEFQAHDIILNPPEVPAWAR